MAPFLSLEDYFDWVAKSDSRTRRIQAGFHYQIAAFYREHVTEDSRVLEAGCGAGSLLALLKPARGLGLDFSRGMIEKARDEHAGNTQLEFRLANAETTEIAEAFDYIIYSFLVGYLSDVQAALSRLHGMAHPRTRLVLTSLNHIWLWPLKWAQWLGLVTPQPPSNWLSNEDIIGLLELVGWEVVHNGSIQLCPVELPVISRFINGFVAKLPLFRRFGLTQTIIARPRCRVALPNQLRCSVIVPARNEAGNIRAAINRIPVLGAGTEIIFVEGNSRDNTWQTIQEETAAYKGPHALIAIQQPGRGKWDAVRAGFEQATGDVLVIQDADLTAPPDALPKFFEAIISGATEFANGSRLVYPMESRAMRFLNFLGNKFFALALSYVLGQPVKDSLCGTKMLLRSDYLRLRERIKELGQFDPFGDFNLLFGAALLDLKIRDIPVRYKDRSYGETNISRFSHGWLLLKMTIFGLFKIRWR